MLDEPKANKEFVYHYRDDRFPYKGNWRNTAWLDYCLGNWSDNR